MEIILCLLVSHYFGDFVFQTEWMAKNKSKDWLILLMHVLTYGLILDIFLLIGCLCGIIDIDPADCGRFVALNMVLHFFVDSITSQVTSYFRSVGNENKFFMTIGFDQLLHQICLIVSSQWVLL